MTKTSCLHPCPFCLLLGCWGAQRRKRRTPASNLLLTPDFLVSPSPSETGATIVSDTQAQVAVRPRPRSHSRQSAPPQAASQGSGLPLVLRAFFSRPRFLKRVSPCGGSLLSAGKWSGAHCYRSVDISCLLCFLQAGEGSRPHAGTVAIPSEA